MNDPVLFAQALADETRWRILRLVFAEALCVCELADILQLPQSTDQLDVSAFGTNASLGLAHFVAGGFAEVTPERVTILADEATPLAELSKAEADRRVAQAEAAYTAAAMDTPEKRETAMATLMAMRAMREVAEAA